MKRHEFDTEERIVGLTYTLTKQLLNDYFTGKFSLDNYLKTLKGRAERLDEVASRKYSGEDLEEYAGRMRMDTIRCFAELEENRKLSEPNYAMVIPLIGHLMAELQCLSHTVEHMSAEEVTV